MFDVMGAIGIGSSLLGGLMGGSASKKAAKAQQQSAAAAQQEIGRQYDTTRGDLAPWRQAGMGAIDRLQYLLGTGGSGSVNPAVGQAQNALSNAQSEYNALLASSSTSSSPGGRWTRDDPGGHTGGEGGDGGANWHWVRDDSPVSSGPDPAALSAARARMEAAQNALNSAQAQPWNAGEGYGSLLKPYQQSTFEEDPGYQFRLQEGNKAIENSAAARGMQLSGANLKGLQRFNSGLASQEYGNWFNRDQSLYGRHSADRDRTFNYLSGTSGQDLNAAAQTGAFGAQAAGSTADLMTQGGNAQAAGIVGGANAFNNAFGDINSQMQYTQMMNLLRGGGNQKGGRYGAPIQRAGGYMEDF